MDALHTNYTLSDYIYNLQVFATTHCLQFFWSLGILLVYDIEPFQKMYLSIFCSHLSIPHIQPTTGFISN